MLKQTSHKSPVTSHPSTSLRASDHAPRFHQKPKRQPDRGLVMVYTGNGKGKSTAAMGTVLRALGYGMTTVVIQFIKGNWPAGEEKALKKFPKSSFFKSGEGFTWETKDFERDVAKAREGWELARKFISDNKTDLVVLDEINCCLQYGFLNLKDILVALRGKPKMKHVLLTGRGAPKKLIQFADLVTEMKSVKHPYDSGIWAQRGIDF